MADKLEVCFGGLGGQGIVLMGTVLGAAGVKEGYWAAGSNSYGAQARGSACRAEVILSSQPVDFPRVIRPDVLVALSQEAYQRFLPEVKEDGLVIHDHPMVQPSQESPVVHFGIGGTDLALESLGSAQAANVIFLGVLAGLTGLVSLAALAQAVDEGVSGKFRDMNQKALQEGFSRGLEARKEFEKSRKGWLERFKIG
jgi:2-oxoglutarate ferredoxin oxidoreductase subunit gamma